MKRRLPRLLLAIGAGLLVNIFLRTEGAPDWAASGFGWVVTWQWYFAYAQV